MIRDLNLDIIFKILPIVREPDGLALSSRNKYFNESVRKKACVLYRTLREGLTLFKNGERDCAVLLRAMNSVLAEEESVKQDYLKICDPETLKELVSIQDKAVILIAAYLQNVRLIDNMILYNEK